MASPALSSSSSSSRPPPSSSPLPIPQPSTPTAPPSPPTPPPPPTTPSSARRQPADAAEPIQWRLQAGVLHERPGYYRSMAREFLMAHKPHSLRWWGDAIRWTSIWRGTAAVVGPAAQQLHHGALEGPYGENLFWAPGGLEGDRRGAQLGGGARVLQPRQQLVLAAGQKMPWLQCQHPDFGISVLLK
ncbi:probable pathogenesis-related protein ARB_02861 [Ananas comosus]|uniref:Probable pathogenesis-related protein ARB_02861 n=1 Tax=Ananas comosus TaxID=4615 RepID=A0A6P5FPZ8_ANACO|nr:probable pathogenesis-related protein ARB_02861 [Ananas comosus]